MPDLARGYLDGYFERTIQPARTDTGRSEAVTRGNALPRCIDTEIANLRQGLEFG